MASRLLRRVTTEDNLWAAWRQVKAAGAGPGLDGRGLEFYANEPERLLDRLQHELRAGRYEPWPLRRAWVPKRGGRWRAVGVGTVRDRVAQRAVLHLLAPRAEEIFNETSFAYRAGRGVRQAVASIDRARRDGLVEVFETDIADCFDSLDHELLRAAIRGLVPESDVRALCWAWLRAGVVTNGQLVRPRRGVAQGDLLSPLWCNLYLDPFDDSAEGRSGQLVRYADDLLYLTRTPAGAEAAQAHVTRELERLRLRLNPDKTRLTSFEEGFEYLGLEFHGSLITDLTWRPAVRGRPLIVGGYDQPVARRPGERPPQVGPPGSRWRYALDAEIARAARRGRPPSQMAQAIAEALAAAEEEAETEANQRSARLL